jgi:hypothetical protein
MSGKRGVTLSSVESSYICLMKYKLSQSDVNMAIKAVVVRGFMLGKRLPVSVRNLLILLRHCSL